MFEKVMKQFCTSMVSQMKIPRKGALMILLTFTSLIILVNKVVFNYSLAPKGSGLLQLVYGLWFFSLCGIFIKIYNEYSDKKDTKKEELRKQQEREQLFNKYFRNFELCDYEETKILAKFYLAQSTSITASYNERACADAMYSKDIEILISKSQAEKIVTTSGGLKIINAYFDRNKLEFFELVNSLEDCERKLLKDFVDNDNKQISLYKNEIRIAKSIISKFSDTKYNDFYIDADDFFTTSTLVQAYLIQYFAK